MLKALANHRATTGFDHTRPNEELLSAVVSVSHLIFVVLEIVQLLLGRDPYKVLGDLPPWSTGTNLLNFGANAKVASFFFFGPS